MRLSSQEAAHGAVGWIGVQEIRGKPFLGLNGEHFTLKMYPTQAKLPWSNLKATLPLHLKYDSRLVRWIVARSLCIRDNAADT